ncbi:MAG TPA: chemotaxis response regulator protein-glutamate methylesterase [Candidatus Kapabacteria bacterium]|jgi:two-component system chemotaxis response regulator CheB|nr:chemotaxis response regulator protein-glutamate methylesterase [Candidatus Kapabacteria bacterium]HPU23034.1 chemotaxis response regulator protein-glutamate methylesterase [Candidatus Kapabacteria bacterium]
MDKIKVIVVDDSVFMRKALTKIINTDDIEVIETAVNGKDAIEKIKQYQPDIVTLDIEMPIMNGIDALKVIMKECPVPVIMISTLTSEGAEATIEALSNGAVDFVTKKPAFTEMNLLQDEIIGKIRSVANNKTLRNQLKRRSLILQKKNEFIQNTATQTERKVSASHLEIAKQLAERAKQRKAQYFQNTNRQRPEPDEIEIIVIGISTGGPVALLELFKRLPGNIPVPILVAQHMPPYFTKSLADRLNGLSELNIKEAEDGETVKPGFVYFAPGGRQMTINKKFNLCVSDEPRNELYKPSVNVLMNSAIDVYGKSMVGVIMTGMGHDGRDALKRLHSIGGYVISQDIESCVVAGMPRSVIDAGVADEIHSLNDLPDAIASLFKLTSK